MARDRAGRGRPVVTVARLLSLAVALVLWSAPAQAHTGLVGSDPAVGGVAPLTLDRLVLEFDDRLLAGSDVVVRGPDGSVVSDGKVGVLGGALDIGLHLTQEGEHTVDYRVVGTDGHPRVGSFSFRASADAVTGAGSSATPLLSTTADRSGASYWLVPVLALAALVLLVHTAAGARTRRRRTAGVSTSA